MLKKRREKIVRAYTRQDLYIARSATGRRGDGPLKQVIICEVDDKQGTLTWLNLKVRAGLSRSVQFFTRPIYWSSPFYSDHVEFFWTKMVSRSLASGKGHSQSIFPCLVSTFWRNTSHEMRRLVWRSIWPEVETLEAMKGNIWLPPLLNHFTSKDSECGEFVTMVSPYGLPRVEFYLTQLFYRRGDLAGRIVHKGFLGHEIAQFYCAQPETVRLFTHNPLILHKPIHSYVLAIQSRNRSPWHQTRRQANQILIYCFKTMLYFSLSLSISFFAPLASPF